MYVLFAIIFLGTTAIMSVNMISSKITGYGLVRNESIPLTVLNIMTSLVLPLFIMKITTDLFSGELSDRSIILSLVRPISRFKIYISKIMSIGLFSLTVLLSTFLLTFILSLFGGSAAEVLIYSPFELLSYIAAIIPMLLVAIITAFFSLLFKSSSAPVILLIISSVILSALTVFFPWVGIISPSSYLDWHQNFSGSFDFYKTIKEFMFILSYGIIFLFSGILAFEKKDI
ncbi:MAG TPA: ABC transporter permease [Clostridia bacterium]